MDLRKLASRISKYVLEYDEYKSLCCSCSLPYAYISVKCFYGKQYFCNHFNAICNINFDLLKRLGVYSHQCNRKLYVINTMTAIATLLATLRVLATKPGTNNSLTPKFAERSNVTVQLHRCL